jgi:hypothetical protein
MTKQERESIQSCIIIDAVNNMRNNISECKSNILYYNKQLDIMTLQLEILQKWQALWNFNDNDIVGKLVDRYSSVDNYFNNKLI